jgi:hypothetical protein
MLIKSSSPQNQWILHIILWICKLQLPPFPQIINVIDAYGHPTYQHDWPVIAESTLFAELLPVATVWVVNFHFQ